MIHKLAIIFILLNGLSFHSFSQSRDSLLVLDELIQEMVQNNPELQSSWNKWQATQTRPSQSGALPDPVLGVGFMNLPIHSLALNEEMMSGRQLSLMQMFPFPGKLGTRKHIMLNEVEIAEQQFLQKKNELIKALKETYFELFYINKAMNTNHKNQAVLNQFLQIAETRYRVGKGLQQDVFKAQLELSELTDNLYELQQQQQLLAAEIDFLLNRRSQTPAPRTEELSFITFEMGLDELQRLAEKHNPFLHSWRITVQQSEQKISLARKEYLPDFSIELTYIQREVLWNGEGGTDLFSGMVGLTLPLYFWNKQARQVKETELDAQASHYMQESAQQMIYREVEKSHSTLQKNQKRWQLFKNIIIPQAEQTLQSALSAYQVDRVDFLTVIDNQMSLYAYELESHRILSDYYKNIAELEVLVGIPLMKAMSEVH